MIYLPSIWYDLFDIILYLIIFKKKFNKRFICYNKDKRHKGWDWYIKTDNDHIRGAEPLAKGIIDDKRKMLGATIMSNARFEPLGYCSFVFTNDNSNGRNQFYMYCQPTHQ